MTGGSSGIGIETARALAGAGADVTLAVRDTGAGERTAADITATTGNPAVHVGRLDLADQASVAAFVADWSGPLHILINNAGVMALPELQLTPEGWEMQFATNHLGHFALAVGLHDALAAAGGARIVSLSSVGHLRSPVVFDDLNFTSRPYDPWARLRAVQDRQRPVRGRGDAPLGRRRHHRQRRPPGGDRGHQPDAAPRPGVPGAGCAQLRGEKVPVVKTLEQGAATSVLVATSPQLEGIGGRYFEDCNEAVLARAPESGGSGVAAYALDPGNANRLWEVSLRTTRFGAISTRSRSKQGADMSQHITL